MQCPACVDHPLKPILTKNGVEIDYCEKCEGIWLDKGEIYYFTKRRKELAEAFQQASKTTKPSPRMSPKTGQPMEEVSFLRGELILDLCPETEGIWFDQGEIEKLVKTDPTMLSIRIDETSKNLFEIRAKNEKSQPARRAVPLLKLPNVALRSIVTLISLYAVLVFILISVSLFTDLNPRIAFIFGVVIVAFQFFISPWVMDISLRWFYKTEWRTLDQLPAHLKEFVTRVCQQNNMNIPRVGFINDGGPNAFTYGHTPNNARIVITRGIFELLDEQEIEAVVAHEIGHARHWDMLLMTAAQIVPLVLYYLYRLIIEWSGRARKKGGGQLMLAAIGAYLLFIISEYIVLWFSRTREYLADRFAGQTTGNPNSLASALVKIAYGLAGQSKEKEQVQQENRSQRLEAVGASGIFDSNIAKSFTVSAYGASKEFSAGQESSSHSNIIEAMKWDLWNPWAKYYELHSTHPLVANRLNYLSNQAESEGQQPFIRFNLQKPESYWDEFFVDILIMLLPFLAFTAAIVAGVFTQQQAIFGLGLIVTGIFSLVKVFFKYPSDEFPEMNISGLLKHVKVSSIRAVPCTLKGTVIGRGVPGLIWSEDFIMKDRTGIMFLDYRQPLRIWEFLFGLMRSRDMQNTEVTLEGWYRRSPVPYVELRTLKTKDKTWRCYVYHLKSIFAILAILAGLAAAFVPASYWAGLF